MQKLFLNGLLTTLGEERDDSWDIDIDVLL